MAKRKNKKFEEKPGFIYGFLGVAAFTVLQLSAFYFDLSILSYFSVIPAAFVVLWFVARVIE